MHAHQLAEGRGDAKYGCGGGCGVYPNWIAGMDVQILGVAN